MPFVTPDDIREEQAALAARAKRLQSALDRTHAILDVLVDDIDHEARSHVARLQASLATSLGWVQDRVRVLDGVGHRLDAEVLTGLVDPVTGEPNALREPSVADRIALHNAVRNTRRPR